MSEIELIQIAEEDDYIGKGLSPNERLESFRTAVAASIEEVRLPEAETAQNYNDHHVLDTLRGIRRSKTSAEVFSRTFSFARKYGFDRVFVGAFFDEAAMSQNDQVPNNILSIKSFLERTTIYGLDQDLLVEIARKNTRPIRWVEAVRFQNRTRGNAPSLLSYEPSKEGYTFPIHGLYHRTGAVSLAGRMSDISRRDMQELDLLAQTVYVRLEELVGIFPYHELVMLSPRETQIIQFAAQGRTDTQIAEILDVRHQTVAKTFQRARKKLNTTNRAHTVALAIAKRQIFG